MKSDQFIYAAILMLGILSVKSLNAQVQLNTGVMVGINWADLNYESKSEAQTNIPGLYLSGLAELEMNQRFALQTELAFVQKGFGMDLSDILKYKYRLNYLELPLFLKFDLIPGPENSMQLYAGPSFGFLISERENASSELGQLDVQQSSVASKDNGFALGWSLRKRSDNGIFAVDLRACFGLTPGVTNSNGESATNQYFMASMSYFFPVVRH